MKIKTNVLISLLVAFAAVAGTAGFVAGRYVSDNKKPNFTKEHVLYVREGMTVSQVSDSIAAGAGTLRPASLERCLRKVGAEGNICGQNDCFRVADTSEPDPFRYDKKQRRDSAENQQPDDG